MLSNHYCNYNNNNNNNNFFCNYDFVIYFQYHLEKFSRRFKSVKLGLIVGLVCGVWNDCSLLKALFSGKRA